MQRCLNPAEILIMFNSKSTVHLKDVHGALILDDFFIRKRYQKITETPKKQEVRNRGFKLQCCCVSQVQEAVHGVTMEECQAALQNHNWNVQQAVHYLKVCAFTES